LPFRFTIYLQKYNNEILINKTVIFDNLESANRLAAEIAAWKLGGFESTRSSLLEIESKKLICTSESQKAKNESVAAGSSYGLRLLVNLKKKKKRKKWNLKRQLYICERAVANYYYYI
jgi:hypothetical protein